MDWTGRREPGFHQGQGPTLQPSHSYGRRRASFHSPTDSAVWRAYLRQRERLLGYAAAHIQPMRQALTR